MAEEEKRDLRFGWGCFRPGFLQFLNGPKWFLFFLIIFSSIQGMTVNGFTKLILPDIERRYQFKGTDLGVIAASNDASALVLVCFVSFFGGYGNKIRWLGYGAYLTAIGCLMFALPQFLIGPYYPGTFSANRSFTEQDLCYRTQNVTSADEVACISAYKSDWYYLLVFVIAQLLMGAGTTPLFSLGPAYIDENVHPKSMPIYLSFWYAATILGPGLGFVVGGYFLSMFVDLKQPSGVNVDADDPRWIGAWWLGFVIGGSVLFVSAFGLLGFPAELPGTRAMREEAMRRGDIPKGNKQMKGNLKDLLPATKELLRNKTYLLNTIATAAEFFAAGISSFLPKILQDKFATTSSSTGFSIGAAIVPGMFIGIMLGGILVRRFKVRESCRMAARLLVIFSVVSMVGPTAWFIPGCDQIELAGVGRPYVNSSISFAGLDATCNADCACVKSQFNPVCGADDVTYFTPCHAGCRGIPEDTKYANCSCVLPQANWTQQTSVQGFCDRGPGCSNYIAFLVLILVLLLTVFLKAIPSRTVVLRCVPDNQRAYALGLQFVFFRALGSLPSPIFYGYLFDTNCILWGESCGQRGNCMVYDMGTLSIYLGVMGLIVGGITFFFFFLSWFFHKPKDDLQLVPMTDDEGTEKIDIGSDSLGRPESPTIKADETLFKGDTRL
ncbi:solute carrier organic anion transporter family member 4A1 isoform X2 [Nematostella vectensis]|nr:solute carrier organic anion transporter family member 4A1 isoform X2 [Nematostella vectensis]